MTAKIRLGLIGATVKGKLVGLSGRPAKPDPGPMQSALEYQRLISGRRQYTPTRSCRRPRTFSQPTERRNWPGVSPATRRKFSVKRLWLENPAATAIAAIERSSWRRSSIAC